MIKMWDTTKRLDAMFFEKKIVYDIVIKQLLHMNKEIVVVQGSDYCISHDHTQACHLQ